MRKSPCTPDPRPSLPSTRHLRLTRILILGLVHVIFGRLTYRIKNGNFRGESLAKNICTKAHVKQTVFDTSASGRSAFR